MVSILVVPIHLAGMHGDELTERTGFKLLSFLLVDVLPVVLSIDAGTTLTLPF